MREGMLRDLTAEERIHFGMAPNSGLFIHAADCEYCAAWPASPCALHRYEQRGGRDE